jgi:hypothetical protein
MSSAKIRCPIPYANLKVTNFENPQISSAPIQKAAKVSSKRYGTAPSANGARQCLQVGSTECSATMRSGQQHYFEPQGPEVCTSVYVLWMILCTLLVSICVCVIHWRLSGLNLNAYLLSNVSRLSLKVNGEVKIFLTPPCIAAAFSSAIHISIFASRSFPAFVSEKKLCHEKKNFSHPSRYMSATIW